MTSARLLRKSATQKLRRGDERGSEHVSQSVIAVVCSSAVIMIVTQSAVVIGLFLTAAGAVYVSNLTPICLRCLCHAASGCNQTLGCVDGFCGPFQLNRAYWKDAGHYVLPEDSPNRDGAFLDCALDYSCAQHIVEEYIIRYGNDCNGDGVTDCDDFAMLHFHLKDDCKNSLDGTNFGRRYLTCRPKADLPDEDSHPHRPFG